MEDFTNVCELYLKNFAKNIKYGRETCCMSISEFVDILNQFSPDLSKYNVTPRELREVESENCRVRLFLLLAASKYLRIRPEKLLSGSCLIRSRYKVREYKPEPIDMKSYERRITKNIELVCKSENDNMNHIFEIIRNDHRYSNIDIYQYIYKIATNPCIDTMCVVSSYFDVSITDLIGNYFFKYMVAHSIGESPKQIHVSSILNDVFFNE